MIRRIGELVMRTQKDVQQDITELSDAAKILDRAEVRDKQYFKDKWEEFLERRDWSTDTFKQDHEDLREVISSVEDNIQRLQEDIDSITDSREEDEREFNDTGEKKIEDIERKSFYGRFYPTLGNSLDYADQEIDKRKRIGVWKAFQTMMDRLGRLKMHKVALTFENRQRKVEEKKQFDDYAKERVGEMKSELKEFVEKKINEKTHRLEKATEANRREHKNIKAFLDNFGEGIVMELGRTNEAFEKIVDVDTETEFSDLRDSDGFGVDLSQSASERDKKRKETEEARRSASETGLGSDEGDVSSSSEDVSSGSGSNGEKSGEKYSLKHKSLEEKHKVLQEMAEEEDLIEMSPQEVADMTDLTRIRFVQKDGVLDKIEEEYGTRFAIDA